MMSVDKAIRLARKWAAGHVCTLREGEAQEYHQLCAEALERSRWIPVTERLPETYDKDPDWSATVLFMTTQGHIHSGYRNVGRLQKSFYDDDWTPPYWLDESEVLCFEENEATHWMPLPDKPKED